MNNETIDTAADADLPSWMDILGDLYQMFAEQKRGKVETAFKKDGVVSEQEMKENAARRDEKVLAWAMATREMAQRFSDRYKDLSLAPGESVRFNITWQGETAPPNAQFYLSHSTQMLLMHHTPGHIETRHVWTHLDELDNPEPHEEFATEDGRVAFIIAEDKKEPDAFGD